MNSFFLATGGAALVITAIIAGFNPLTSLQNVIAPQQQAQTAQIIPPTPVPKTEPVEVEELPPLPKPKPPVVEKAKPKPKPKPPMKIAERPAYCNDIDRGVSWLGSIDRVRGEARRRGKTEKEIADAEKACGY